MRFDLERLSVVGETIPLVEGVWTNAAAGTAHIALSQNGTLAFVPQASEERRLVWVDREGVVRPLTNSRRGFEDPRLSPDGQKLSVSVNEGGLSHIWIYEMARDAFVRFSFGPEDHARSLWTPDGKRLTFQKGMPFNLFWQPADEGGDAERLTTSPYHQFPSSWSPDGKALVYMEWTQGSDTEDLWLLSREGEPRERPLLQTPFREPHGAISPDGRLLAYMSDESGRFEIYVRQFPAPGGKWPISNEGGAGPIWARSGREIFYRNGRKMMAVAIETEPVFRAKRPAVLFEGEFYRPGGSFPQYDVTADGENFVMIEDFDSRPTQIHVVLNWFEELKARVPSAKR